MNNKQIVIIGGGAAGFFGAIRAAELDPAARVVILEKGKEVLTKVKVSGGGRCNVTHACFVPRDLSRHYPRGEKELIGPFHRFACGDMLDWLDRRGVATKIEEDGRIFPITDDSQTIIDCFSEACRQLNIEVLTRQRVDEIQLPENEKGQWTIVTPKKKFSADKVMLATGSSKRMWALLAGLGYRIVDPVPSLFTFNIKDERIKDLPGISMPHARVKVLGTSLESEGPVLITHWGLSGPAILKLSAWGARELHTLQYHFDIQLNWTGMEMEDIKEELIGFKSEFGRRTVSKQQMFSIPARLWKTLCRAAQIDEQLNWADLNKKQIHALTRQIGGAVFEVKGKSTFKEEFVTAGGVDLREINFKTFESKRHPGLFFAGEVLNIDAITGGFNFQAAWTGGWIAGQGMVE